MRGSCVWGPGGSCDPLYRIDVFCRNNNFSNRSQKATIQVRRCASTLPVVMPTGTAPAPKHLSLFWETSVTILGNTGHYLGPLAT